MASIQEIDFAIDGHIEHVYKGFEWAVELVVERWSSGAVMRYNAMISAQIKL